MQLIASGIELAVLRQAWRRRKCSKSSWRNTWKLICVCGMIILKFMLRNLVLF